MSTTANTTLAEEIAAVLSDVVDVTGAAISGLTFGVGRRELTLNTSPPRVVWVRTGAQPGPPVKNHFPTGTRSVVTRSMELALHAWGSDENATDLLVAAVLAACHRRWHGRWSYRGETWESAPAQTEAGEMAVVRITVDTAVLDRPKTTVTIETASPDPTPAVAGDGVLHVGENT